MCYYCGRRFHVCDCVLAVSSAVSVITKTAVVIEKFTAIVPVHVLIFYSVI